MNMEQEELREPMLNDLCCLSVVGNISYAIRCARRMQPRFQLPASMADADKMTAIVDAAMAWGEEFVQTGAGDVERGEALADATSAIAQMTCDDTDYAAYAAHHSVRGALLTAKAGGVYNQDLQMEVVAAAFGSSRVLLTNTPPWLRLRVINALRSDFDKLLAMAQTHAMPLGDRFDPCATGPLGEIWLGEKPTW